MIYTYNAQCTGPPRRIRAPPTVDKRETREAKPAPAAGSRRRQARTSAPQSRSHTQMCDVNCALYAMIGRDPAAHPIVHGKHFRRRLPVSHPPLPPQPNTRQRSRPLASSPAASVPRVRPAPAFALLRFPAPSGSRSGQGRLRIMNRGAPRLFVLSTVFGSVTALAATGFRPLAESERKGSADSLPRGFLCASPRRGGPSRSP